PADSPAGVAPAWVRSLSRLYAARIQPFAARMAGELTLLGRNPTARALALATLEGNPDDIESCLVYSLCSGRLRRYGDARHATERALTLTRGPDIDPQLALMHARALQHLDDATGARHELMALAARVGAEDPVGREARRMIGERTPAHARVAEPMAGDRP